MHLYKRDATLADGASRSAIFEQYSILHGSQWVQWCYWLQVSSFVVYFLALTLVLVDVTKLFTTRHRQYSSHSRQLHVHWTCAIVSLYHVIFVLGRLKTSKDTHMMSAVLGSGKCSVSSVLLWWLTLFQLGMSFSETYLAKWLFFDIIGFGREHHHL